MAVLHLANTFTEDIFGDLGSIPEGARRSAGCGAHRLVWFLGEGDVCVFGVLPEDSYVDYVTALTGVRRSSLRLLAPPPGALGADLLSPDRLAAEEFRAELREIVQAHGVDALSPVCSDTAAASLAEAVGLATAMPGYAFSRQGGNTVVNSKAVFRATGAGVGTPMAPGVVAATRADASAFIENELSAGHPVIVKLDHHAGGLGNEVIARRAGFSLIGARELIVAEDRGAVEDYLRARWDRLTGGRRDPVVLERYYPDSVPLYIEFVVTDDGVELLGHGQMMMEPTYAGAVTPAPGLTATELAELEAGGRLLGEAVRALGYRGVFTPDAFLTPDRGLLFSEINGRISGVTHLHTAVGRAFGGPDSIKDRVLLERGGLAVPSFDAAVKTLERTGLGVNRTSRTGVVLIFDTSRVDGSVRYCVVAEDIDAAYATERRLGAVFG